MNDLIYVLGLDPASGKSSPAGLALVEYDISRDRFKLLQVGTMFNITNDVSVNSSAIVEQVEIIWRYVERTYPGQCYFASEEPRMFGKGKAATYMERLLGRVEHVISVQGGARIIWVNQTTLKKKVANNGKAEKDEVAVALLNYQWDSRAADSSTKKITKLTSDEKWDETDAIAVAVHAALEVANGIKNRPEV